MGLHFTAALLQDGWANDVRLTLDGSRIAKVERDVAAWPDDERAGIDRGSACIVVLVAQGERPAALLDECAAHAAADTAVEDNAAKIDWLPSLATCRSLRRKRIVPPSPRSAN